MRQCCSPRCRSLSRSDKPVEVRILAARESRLQHLQAAADAGKQVVEVMRHAARELTESFELLGLAQLIFRCLQFARPLLYAPLQCFIQLAQLTFDAVLFSDVARDGKKLLRAPVRARE